MTLLRILAGGACIMLAAATAFGQQNVPDVKPDKPWVAILFAVVLSIGAVVASVMTPKRTHKD
jgi:hypothetical protein